MSSIVTLETPQPGVALVTVNNPDIDNQGSWEAISGLAAQLEKARDQGCYVAVIASGVPGHWLEHAYLDDLCNTFQGKPTTGDAACWFKALQQITHPELICIAAVEGSASGGGAELGWACDLRIAGESSTFMQPEISLGVAPGLGGTGRLARLAGRGVAAAMALGGKPERAARLHDLGALNEVVPDGQVVEAAMSWAGRIAEGSPAALKNIKQQLINSDNELLEAALQKEQMLFQQLVFNKDVLGTIRGVQDRYDAGETMTDVHGS